MFRKLRKLVGLNAKARNATQPRQRLGAGHKFSLGLEALEARDVPAVLFLGSAFTQDGLPADLGSLPQGQTFTLPISVSVTETAGVSVAGADVAFRFDPAVFTFNSVTNGAIANGSLPSAGNTPLAFSTQASEVTPGTVRMTGSSAQGPNLAFNSTNSLFLVTLTVKPGATLGVTRFNLVAQDGTFNTALQNNVPQQLTLLPAPTAGATDDVDAFYTVAAGTQPTLKIPTDVPAVAGAQVTVPINFVAGTATTSVAGADVQIQFDPAVLTFVSIANGVIADGSLGGGALAYSTQAAVTSPGILRMTGSSAQGPTLGANSTNSLFLLTFQVAANAPAGSTPLNIQAANGYTAVQNNVPAQIPLSPAPADGTDATDGSVLVQSAVPPTLDLNGNGTGTGSSANFVQFGGPVAIVGTTGTAGLTVTAGSAATLTGATVTLTNPVTAASEVLAATTTGTPITATYTAATGVLALTGSATAAQYQQVLRTVTYNNTTLPLPPGQPDRVVRFVVTDGSLSSNVAVSTVRVNVQSNQAPAHTVPGTQTVLARTPVTFAGSTAIGVTDADAGAGTLTTILSVGAAGTLTVATPLPTGVAVSNNGTGTVTVTGTAAGTTAVLAGLVFAPAATFVGTATLTVRTNDNGNSGYTDPLLGVNDGQGLGYVRQSTVSIRVVGLKISEVNLTTTSSLQSPSTTQYLEVYSTVPGFTIPSGVYFVGVEGDNDTITDTYGNVGTSNPGQVQDRFNLSGFTTGTNGYLALLQRNQAYTTSSGVVTPGGAAVPNAGATAAAGFGNGGAGSQFGTLTGVHVGEDPGSGVRPGTNPNLLGDGSVAPTAGSVDGAGSSGTAYDGTAFGEISVDLEGGSASYMLVQTGTAPTLTTDIDANNDGTPDGTAFAGWTVLDSVGILDTEPPFTLPTDGDGVRTATRVVNGPDRSYAGITFNASATGTTVAGSTTVSVGFTPTYVGRISQSSGSAATDWLASVPVAATGAPTGPGYWRLSPTNTSNTNYASQRLNHVAGPNLWTVQPTVLVNDGSTAQRSQVTQFTVTFNGPVRLALGANAGGTAAALPAAINSLVSVVNGSNQAVNINVSIPSGFGTYVGTTGVAQNVTQLVIRFATTSGLTTTVANDPLGNTVGLVDGNWFVRLANEVGALNISDQFVATRRIDTDRDGVAGGAASNDEFYRYFGDADGNRNVDGLDNVAFGNAFGSSTTVNTAAFRWFFDFNANGTIDSTDRTAFRANRGTSLTP